MIRPITADELSWLRSSSQHTKIRAVFVDQPTVFVAQVSGSFASVSNVSRIPIKNITYGSTADIKDGMTIYIGSGSGLSDIGMCRAKSYETSGSKIKIGRTSDVNYYDGAYVTVVNDYGFWSRMPSLDPNNISAGDESEDAALAMDDDVQYTNQNDVMNPVVLMGADMALPLTAGSIAVSGSNSYCFSHPISTYTWSATSGSMIHTSGSNPNAVFQFASAGFYGLSLTVVTSAGKQSTGRRTLQVYDEGANKPVEDLVVQSMSAEAASGGWTAQVQMWDKAALPLVRDRAKIILIADDYYSGSAVSFGQVPGLEKVLMVGWIAGESIKYDSQNSSVTFTVYTSNFWINSIPDMSGFMQASKGVPTGWTSIQDMTIDEFVWHFYYWCSTVMNIIDVFPSNNDRMCGGNAVAISPVWAQVDNTLKSRMMMLQKCNRYSQLFLCEDPMLQSLTDRASVVNVMTLTDDDLYNEVDLKRVVMSNVGILEVCALSGYAESGDLRWSRAPGDLTYKRFGENRTFDRAIVRDQDDANMLAGMLIAKLNNDYPDTTFMIGQNNRMIDIAPNMWLTYSVSGSQNARGASFTNRRFLPSRIDYRFKTDKGYMTVDITADGETSGSPGVKVDAPPDVAYNFSTGDSGYSGSAIDYAFDPFGGFGGFGFQSDILPVENTVFDSSGSGCPNSAPENVIDLYASGDFYSDTKKRIIIPLNCVVRSSSHLYLTRYKLFGEFYKRNTTTGAFVETNLDDWYDVYALDASGNRIIQGVHDATSGSSADYRSGTLASSGSTIFQQVSGFELVIDPDSFVPTSVTQSYVDVYSTTLGTMTWGLTDTGVWIHDAGGYGQRADWAIYGRVLYQISGSPASYDGQWFSVKSKKVKSAEWVSGTNYGSTAYQDNEPNYNNDFKWELYQIEHGYSPSYWTLIMSDSRTLTGGSIVSNQDTGLIQNVSSRYPPGQPDVCIMAHDSLRCKSATYKAYEDSLDIEVTFAPTYWIHLKSWVMLNLCAVPDNPVINKGII